MSNKNDELRMQVSPICDKNGEKIAYVTFSDAVRQAEGEIPKCTIISSVGYTDDEVNALELYMKQNLDMLKDLAKDLNPIKAMLDKQEPT